MSAPQVLLQSTKHIPSKPTHLCLRAATRNVHLRLHKHPVTTPLIKPSLSLAQYIRALQAFERFHQMLETHVLRPIPDFPLISKSTSARHDCHQLKAPDNPLPICPRLTLDDSLDTQLGVRYVIEGANQGGLIIANNLQKTLGLNGDNGASFFNNLDRDKAPENWQRFTRYIDDHCESTEDCCKAAQSTFTALEDYLWLAEQRSHAEEP